MTDDLLAALVELAEAIEAAEPREPWWVFGGAAMALSGLQDWRVPDIDVLTGTGDARRLIAALGGEEITDPGEGMFRSRVYGRRPGGALPIEVMAGLEVRTAGEWTPVTFESRVPVALAGHVLHIPSVAEQIAVARQFGRPKDLARADALERLNLS